MVLGGPAAFAVSSRSPGSSSSRKRRMALDGASARRFLSETPPAVPATIASRMSSRTLYFCTRQMPWTSGAPWLGPPSALLRREEAQPPLDARVIRPPRRGARADAKGAAVRTGHASDACRAGRTREDVPSASAPRSDDLRTEPEVHPHRRPPTTSAPRPPAKRQANPSVKHTTTSRSGIQDPRRVFLRQAIDSAALPAVDSVRRSAADRSNADMADDTAAGWHRPTARRVDRT